MYEGTQDTAPGGRGFNPVEAAVGVLARPVDAMRRIAAARPWPIAIALSIGLALLSGLAGMTAPDTTVEDLNSAGAFDLETAQRIADLLNAIQSPLFAVVSALLAPLGLAITSGILYLCGRLLGGRGPYSALFSTEGFASIPSALLVPFTVLFNLIGGVGASLGSCLSFLVGIWVLVLTALAIRESLNLSTGRAIAALLIPLVALLGLSCVLTFLIVAAVGGGA